MHFVDIEKIQNYTKDFGNIIFIEVSVESAVLIIFKFPEEKEL